MTWALPPSASCVLFALIISTVFFGFVVQTAVARPTTACAYQPPDPDDVHLGGVADNDESSYRERRSPAVVRWRPLRIHLHWDESALAVDESTRSIVVQLLQDAVEKLEGALSVRESPQDQEPLLLRRRCISNYSLFHKERGELACEEGCRERTVCGEVLVPSKHLQECVSCSASGLCSTTGSRGDGLPVGTHFVLYVSAISSRRCGLESGETLAYAAHCQQEREMDRPIAGHVNLCLSGLPRHPLDFEAAASTLRHEIIHALGFSSALFAFWRHDDGRPRTKRNRYGRPERLNRERGHYEWDSSTIRTILRTDWWTASGQIIHPVEMVVTERVRAEVRRHFNCSILEGAELENQGGPGTARTHFEKRLFENEAMTGTHTQNPVYSRLTLAMLEDTGWYRANYSTADDLSWGKNLGCEFAMKSCGEWIKRRRSLGLSPSPFCDAIKHNGRHSLAVVRCTEGRDSLALCNLVPFKRPLPPAYRNFDHLDDFYEDFTITNLTVAHFGGAVELADFCPFHQEFEWKSEEKRVLESAEDDSDSSPSSSSSSSISAEKEKSLEKNHHPKPERRQRRDSRCEVEGNGDDSEFGVSALFEVYGSHSRCLDTADEWTDEKCDRRLPYTHLAAGCYQTECVNGSVLVTISGALEKIRCSSTSQVIRIERNLKDGWTRRGSIRCPDCREICGDRCNDGGVNPSKKEEEELRVRFEDDNGPPKEAVCAANLNRISVSVITIAILSELVHFIAM